MPGLIVHDPPARVSYNVRTTYRYVHASGYLITLIVRRLRVFFPLVELPAF
jgi:hypothetical protein